MTDMRLLAALVVLITAAPATAQPRAVHADVEAKEQYDRGVVAYNLERFEEAITAFTRAYELDPAPMLLFNIAQARWKKGESDRALFYYRRYLEADPTAENREQVEARIRELEAARPLPAPIQAVAAVTLAPAVPIPPPAYVQSRPAGSRPPPLYRRRWFWGAVGVVALAAVTVGLIATRDTSAPGCPAADCNLGRVMVPGL